METNKCNLLKSFKCFQCNLSFRKCVKSKEFESNCPTCDTKCKETPQASLAEKMHKLMSKQKEKCSPFTGSVNRSQHEFSTMFNTYSFDVFEDFFIDNYSSNFTSNFQNPMTRIVFVKSQKINKDIKQLPSSEIDGLFHIKMNKLYCKSIHKDHNDDILFEYPTCLICLREIVEDANTIIINCGHIFHSGCITCSLEKHGICPVCQYNIKDNKKDITKMNKSDQSKEKKNKKEEIYVVKRAISTPVGFLSNKVFAQQNINIYGEQEAIIS